MEFASFKLF